MKNNLEDFIYIKRIIPKVFCDKIIREIKDLNWEKHKWYKGKEKIYDEPDKTELEILFSTVEQHKFIQPFISKALDEYQNIPHINPLKEKFLNNLSRLRFNRYTTNTLMKPHYDLIRDIWPSGDSGVPIVSIVGNLNHNYQGGDFYIRNKKYELKDGYIMLFPSTFIFNHEVKAITKGERYSFVSWAF